MMLPDEALRRLRAAREQMIGPGDVWWLPDQHVRYPGGKDRFCLVVAMEHRLGGEGPLVVHFVAGSTKGRSGPTTIEIPKGECGLHEDTFFRFWWSGSKAATIVAEEGRWRGRLDGGRLPEIDLAIQASGLIVLKRLST